MTNPFDEAIGAIRGTSWLDEAARSSLRAASAKFYPSGDGRNGQSILPVIWTELLAALILLGRGRLDDERSPLHCSHEHLFVRADAESFTPDELDRLKSWGFLPEEPGWFCSTRYGS